MPLTSGADLPPGAEARLANLEEAVMRLGQLVEHIYASPQLGLQIPPPPGSGAVGAVGTGGAGGAGGAGIDPQVQELIGKRDLIGAIKRYREVTGVGLVEAKAAVEALARRA